MFFFAGRHIPSPVKEPGQGLSLSDYTGSVKLHLGDQLFPEDLTCFRCICHPVLSSKNIGWKGLL